MTPSALGEKRNNSQSVDSEDQYLDGSPLLKGTDGNNANSAGVSP